VVPVDFATSSPSMVIGARLLREKPPALLPVENGDWLSLKPPPACPLRPLWPRARLAWARCQPGVE
jgi:hypothetical protein